MLRKRNSCVPRNLLFLCARYPFCYISDEPLARVKKQSDQKTKRTGLTSRNKAVHPKGAFGRFFFVWAFVRLKWERGGAVGAASGFAQIETARRGLPRSGRSSFDQAGSTSQRCTRSRQGTPHARPSRNSRRKILPTLLFGSSVRNSMIFGRL